MDKKTKNILLLFLGLAFILGSNLYFRSFPVFFPQLKDSARQKIENNMWERASAIVNDKFSNLSGESRDTLS